jgi:hypothetical protein
MIVAEEVASARAQTASAEVFARAAAGDERGQHDERQGALRTIRAVLRV